MEKVKAKKTKIVRHLNQICIGPSLTFPQITKLRKEVEQNKKLKELSDYFFIFSGKKRLEILYLLERQNELCVCDIADILKSTVSAISHQLKILKQADLVKIRREKQVIFYSLNKTPKTKKFFDFFKSNLKGK
jgi:ArsR family transcriptional regulator